MEPIGELVSELVIKVTDTVRLTFEKVTPPTKVVVIFWITHSFVL